MKVMNIFFLVLLAFGVSADEVNDVSVVSLIANPQEYEGKKICIIGFLHIGHEADAIYLHKDDFFTGNISSAIWLDFSEGNRQLYKNYDEKYVALVGTFHTKIKGHLDMYPSGIVVDKIQIRQKKESDKK